MFQQILQFLSYKDEILQGYEEGRQNQLFMRHGPDHDIQRVIFDKNYLKFTKTRELAMSGAELPPQEQPQFSMSKFQYIQYECLKTELKEEYERKMNVMQKRMGGKAQGAYQEANTIFTKSDPSAFLRQASNRSGAAVSEQHPRRSYGLEQEWATEPAKNRNARARQPRLNDGARRKRTISTSLTKEA